MNKFLHWSPRILALLLAIFLSIFSLDILSEEYSLTESIVAFTMHLLPVLVLIGILALSWKKDLWGSLLFALLAIFSFFFFRMDISASLLISLPLLIIGVLFLINYKFNKINAK